MLLNVLLTFWCTYFFGFLTCISAMKSEDSLMCKTVDFFFKNTCWIFFFLTTFASVKAFQTYFCVKLQCILDLFYHLLKECEYSLILYDLFCLVCMHAVRSCLPLLRIPKAVGHFGIRGHWVKGAACIDWVCFYWLPV